MPVQDLLGAPASSRLMLRRCAPLPAGSRRSQWTLSAVVTAVALLTATHAAGGPPPVPLDPRDPALLCRGLNGKVGRSAILRDLAAGLAGEVQLAQATKVDIEDELDLFEKLGLMEGHLMIGKALLEARMVNDALPHFGHPVSEIYDYLKPVFKARSHPGFDADLRDLEARAKAAPDAPATATAYDAVLAKIDGLRRTIPASLSGTPGFVVRGIALMMEASADDLAEAIDKGRVANSVEYHDAMGFARYAEKVLAANRSLLGDKAGGITTELQFTLSAFPSLKPSSQPPHSPADLTAAAGRVKERAK